MVRLFPISEQKEDPQERSLHLMTGEADPPSDEFSDEDVIASVLENIATHPPSKRRKIIKYLEKRGAHGAAEAVRSLPPLPVQLRLGEKRGWLLQI